MGGSGCKKVSPCHLCFEDHHVRRSPIFRPNSSEDQKKVIRRKKRSSRRQTVIWAKTFQNFGVNMIWHVFTDQNAEKEDIWAFFSVLGGQIIFC